MDKAYVQVREGDEVKQKIVKTKKMTIEEANKTFKEMYKEERGR